MLKYEYVTVENEKVIGARITRHRDIIDIYTRNGYRYVGYIPVKTNDYGKIQEIDLVFEIDE